MVQDVSLWSHNSQQPMQLNTATEMPPLHIERVLGKIIKNGNLHYVI